MLTLVADLVVVTGPPGAGKSTVARVLADLLEPGVLIPGDAFFAFVARGSVAPWLPEAHEQNDVVLRAAASAAGCFAAGGYTVVYDGVVGPWFLPAFTAAAGPVRLHYVVLMPPEQQCLHRVATRRDHGFTDAAAAYRMYRDFADADVEARHLVTDLPQRPTDVAAVILERVADRTLLYEP